MVSGEVVRHATPDAFLAAAESWLLAAEDRNNLILGIAYELGRNPELAPDAFFGTVEAAGRLVGCCVRTPPHQILLSDMPSEVIERVALCFAQTYGEIPGVLGPPALAEAVAKHWVGIRGGVWEPATDQRLYRLDEVAWPDPVPGRLREADSAEADLLTEWGREFARETHIGSGPSIEAVSAWIDSQSLYVWDDEGVVSMAVTRGRTRNGIRIGYVYTPPERRKRGYAGACVAAVSQRMLASGLQFCVLYADLSNPTTNALYQRLGYRPVADVSDYLIRGA